MLIRPVVNREMFVFEKLKIWEYLPFIYPMFNKPYETMNPLSKVLQISFLLTELLFQLNFNIDLNISSRWFLLFTE